MSFQDVEKGAPLPLPDIRHPDPSQAVTAGMFQISTNISTFKRLVNTIGTPKDTPDLRERLRNTRLKIGQLFKETKAKLKTAKDIDRVGDVKPAKQIADAKLLKDFEALLTDFQKAQKIAAEREDAFSPFIAQSDSPSNVANIPATINYALDPQNNPNITAEDSRKGYSQLEQIRYDVGILEGEVVFNEALIEERDQGIREIQQDMTEVHEMFKDLAVLVHEQGVIIDDIDSYIENSHAATSQATKQLVKGSKSQKSNSSLACLLLVIFGVALVIVIIVLAT